MRENQNTISNWAAATFGDAGSNARVAARVNEEFAEFLRAYTAGKPAKEIAMELADTKIVLYCLASRHDVPLSIQSQFTRGVHQDVAVPDAVRAMSRMMVEALDNSMGVVPALYTFAARLHDIASYLGFVLDELVDEKMAINRQRVWKRDGSGCGYHMRPKEEPLGEPKRAFEETTSLTKVVREHFLGAEDA